jgi:hypothetical protein
MKNTDGQRFDKKYIQDLYECIILILEKIPFPSCYRLPTMLGAGAWKL